MPIDVSQISSYFVTSSPAIWSMFTFFLPVLYLTLAVFLGVGALKFFIGAMKMGFQKFISKTMHSSSGGEWFKDV